MNKTFPRPPQCRRQRCLRAWQSQSRGPLLGVKTGQGRGRRSIETTRWFAQPTSNHSHPRISCMPWTSFQGKTAACCAHSPCILHHFPPKVAGLKVETVHAPTSPSQRRGSFYCPAYPPDEKAHPSSWQGALLTSKGTIARSFVGPGAGPSDHPQDRNVDNPSPILGRSSAKLHTFR
jgi:hypothetical protein